MPPDLESASTLLGGPGKQDDGKQLIQKFCFPDSPPVDTTDPDWPRFLAYAARDVVALRDMWLKTRPLTAAEWAVYHASERINERGVAVDMHFVKHASTLANADVRRSNARIRQLTEGRLTSVYQHQAIAQWAHDRLPAEGQAILIVALKEEQEDEDDEPEILPVLSLDRRIVGRLLAFIERERIDDPVLVEVLKLREFGASSSPKKFHKILDQVNADGRLRGQYTFNGASTGRFSGKGVQLHNLNRTPLGGDYGDWEEPAIELINQACDLDALHGLGDGEVPSRKLSLLVRPAFVAPNRKTLVKADYSQVEARGLPWLAKSRDAEKRLDIFREIDRNPDAPDIYRVSAAQMLRKSIDDVSNAERQGGKVTELACGFGGAVGALLSMAAGYGIYLTREEAAANVTMWRNANPWAPAFWGRHSPHESYGLWGAAMRAYQAPGSLQVAGRIGYLFEPRLYNGTLVAVLPSSRPLFYPFCKWRQYEVRDKRTKEVKQVKDTLVYRRNGNYVPLWPGLLAENVTQAACADLLREALVGLERIGESVVLHSHDEIVVETDDADRTAMLMRKAMLRERPWIEGFPLAIEITERWWYSAAKQRRAA
jgi:DNA polymerase